MAVGYQKRKKFLGHFYGPPGTGKTTFMASVSKFWDPAWPNIPKGSMHPLDDIIFVEYDAGGLESLSSEGILVPTIEYDDVLAECGGNVIEANQKVLTLLDAHYQENEQCKFILFDTLTALDKHFNSFFKKALDQDTQTGYRLIGQAWRDWHLGNRSIGSHLLYGSHAKFIDENRKRKDGSPLDPGAKKKAKATRSDVGIEIFPDITGATKDLLRGDESLRAVCRKRYDDEDKPVFERYYTSDEGFEGKKRYRSISDVNSEWLRKLLEAEGLLA